MSQATVNAGASSNLAALARGRHTPGPSWLAELRRVALERFEQTGWPTTREEAWRQTNLAPLARRSFAVGEPVLSGEAFAAYPLAGLDGPRIVFVNGRLAEHLSSLAGLPAGVRVEALAAVIAARPAALQPLLAQGPEPAPHSLACLNTAAFEDGALIEIEPGCAVEPPIHVVYLSSGENQPTVSHPRTIVALGASSQARLVEVFHGAAPAGYFTNAVSQVWVADNAGLEHARIQWESRNAHHVGVAHSRLGRDSRYVQHNISFGAALARHDIQSVLDGQGAETTLNGLYLAIDGQHVDNHTGLDHARAHCPSHELYKGILAGQARAVFNGKILVRPGAQKTDAKQSNKNLLLSNDALVHTRPQLEIYADDVKCTHGATIGQLDADALFYLRARGIPLARARSLLIQGFASDVLERISIEPLRERLERHAVDTIAAVLERGMDPEDERG